MDKLRGTLNAGKFILILVEPVVDVQFEYAKAWRYEHPACNGVIPATAKNSKLLVRAVPDKIT